MNQSEIAKHIVDAMNAARMHSMDINSKWTPRVCDHSVRNVLAMHCVEFAYYDAPRIDRRRRLAELAHAGGGTTARMDRKRRLAELAR